MVKTVSERADHPSCLRFEWKVCDFSTSSFLESGIFHFYGLQWKLLLRTLPYYDVYNALQFSIEVTLITISPQIGNGRLCIQSFIEDSSKNTWFSTIRYFDISSESSKQVWETQFFVPPIEHKNGWLTETPVTFVFTLTSEEDQPVKEKEEKGVQACMNSKSEASAERCPLAVVDFRRLLADGTHVDVTLKSGNVTIPAHRLILSSHSEVFSAMLRGDMEKSCSRIIEISNIDPPVLDQLVQFMYSGQLSNLTMETAQQMFVAGDKYAVETLKGQCSAFMKENMAEGNVCSILVLADAHKNKELRECAISFIMDTELTQKDDIWLKFCDDHSKLANEVLNRALKAAKSLK